MDVKINDGERVEIMYPDGVTQEIPPPSHKVRADLRRSIPGDRIAAMYYFLVKILKLSDNKMTERIIMALVRSGITPKMLCLADLTELSYHVMNFGPKSVQILETAIRSYK